MTWAGKPTDYKTPTETALAFEGLRRQVVLQAAGWGSLAEYVSANVEAIKRGERKAPTGTEPVPKIEPQEPAALRNISDHGNAKQADIVAEMKRLQRELDALQKQRETARGQRRIDIESKMRPLQRQLDKLEHSTRHWQPRRP